MSGGCEGQFISIAHRRTTLNDPVFISLRELARVLFVHLRPALYIIGGGGRLLHRRYIAIAGRKHFHKLRSHDPATSATFSRITYTHSFIIRAAA
jgi:hypothetical protein